MPQSNHSSQKHSRTPPRRRAFLKAAAGAVLAAGITLASPFHAHAGESLDTSALKLLFPGSFEGVVHGLVDVRINASSNGRLSGRMMGEIDYGYWVVSEGRLCVAWDAWTKGKFECSYVQRDGDWFTADHGGPIRFRKF